MIPAPSIGSFVFDSFTSYYYLVMTAAIVGIYFSFSILRSATGRAFQAIREDTIAASVNGINVVKYKLLAFVLSAIYAGLAGALFAHMPPGYLHHNNFTVIEMVTLLLMVVLGGIGNVWGGVIGAIVVAIAYDQTKDLVFYFMDRPVVVQPLVFGLSMVLLVMFMPRGIGGWIEDFQRNRRFIRRSEERLGGTAETRNLSKSFGGLHAINDVSLKVEPNTVHGLIGPNGSGKSTFFNLLTGVYQPDAGSYIEFDNVEVTGKPAHYIAEQGLSRTFQLLRLYGELSVLDNVCWVSPTHQIQLVCPIFQWCRGASTRSDCQR